MANGECKLTEINNWLRKFQIPLPRTTPNVSGIDLDESEPHSIYFILY